MKWVGITGGIASGKSTVLQLLTSMGYCVIDADQVAREVVEPGSEGLTKVVQEFGEARMDLAWQSQVVQRKKLSSASEQTNDGAFAVQGGTRADTHFDVADSFTNPSFLRNFRLISKQSRKDLQPRDDVGVGGVGKGAHVLQHSVKSPTHVEPGGCRLQMDVARLYLLSRR